MALLQLRLTKKGRETIAYLLKYEEPRVIHRADILNCLHLGYFSGETAQILQVDPKSVTSVGNAYQEAGLETAFFNLKPWQEKMWASGNSMPNTFEKWKTCSMSTNTRITRNSR